VGRIAASLDLPYPAERVFRAATRIPDLPRWMPEVASAELLDPVLAAGARVKLRLSEAAAGAEVLGTVSSLEPPHRLVIAGSGGPIGVQVRVELRETVPGTTHAELEIDLETPPFLGFIAREAERRIKAGLPEALARLRALIDAEPA
jgi:uncharacterized protein YndB with AHSA1/START domain